MSEMNLKDLVKTVEQSVDETHRNKNFKRNQNKKKWADENGKRFFETIIVPTSYEEISIENAKGKLSTFKRAFVNDEDIIESIRRCSKNNISKSLYWFNGGHYLFTTDNDTIYNLKRKFGTLSKEDKDKIEEMKKDFQESLDEVKEERRIAEILIKAYVDEDEATLNDPNNLVYLLMGEQEAYRFIRKTQIRINEIKEERKELAEKIKKINFDAMDKEIFEIHEMSVKNQVRVYFPENQRAKFNGLGYKVYTVKSKDSNRMWNDSTLDFDSHDYEKISYYVIMNKKAFISACKFDKVPYCGFFYDENGEPMKIEDYSIKILVNGFEREFESIREAANELGVSHTELRRNKNENGIIIYNTKKGIVLKDSDGNEISFKSKSEMADVLKTSRVTINNSLLHIYKLLYVIDWNKV